MENECKYLISSIENYYAIKSNKNIDEKSELEFIDVCKKKFNGYKQILKNNPDISDSQSMKAYHTELMLDQ